MDMLFQSNYCTKILRSCLTINTNRKVLDLKKNNMYNQLGQLKKTRNVVLKLISDLSIEQLNKVPVEFNNNIVWNFAHLMASQQGLCYIRAGAKPIIDEQHIASYKGGTKPEKKVGASELESMKLLFLSTIDQLEKDYENKLFANYQPFTTGLGIEINNIDEAIDFLFFHEGLHTGYMMALKRLVKA